jgi:uncharacterized membrane protein YvbJ
MYCKNCGQKADDNLVKCPNCGNLLHETPVQQAQQSIQTNTKVIIKGRKHRFLCCCSICCVFLIISVIAFAFTIVR